ncbi:MAG: Ig-like domain-containing protein [Oscillospiraceae bacterium]|nr:Ig-like domain-containing protein [Oscillospiraceae bacterium]
MKTGTRLFTIITAVLLTAAAAPLPAQAPGSALAAWYDSYDPRYEGGALTGIRDQGADDVSYAFATAAAAEIALIRAGIAGPDIDLSEQHIRFAMSKSGGNNLGFTSAQGAALTSSASSDPRASIAAYLTRGRLGGLVAEAYDPYKAGDQSRAQSVTADKISSYRVGDVVYIPDMPAATPNDTQSYYREKHINDLKAAITRYGAVTGWIYGPKTTSKAGAAGEYWNGKSMMSYGHLKAGELTQTPGNWCVTAVGWDDGYIFTEYEEEDDKGVNNLKNKPSQPGAFIIKNSWGAETGDAGYFYLSYMDSLLLRNAFALGGVKLAGDNSSPADKIYEHDPLGPTGRTVSSGAWMANVFPVEKDGQHANAVSFAAADAGTQYDIYIMRYASGTSLPGEGGPAATLTGLMENGERVASGTVELPGYYTVDIDRVWLGDKGDTVFVAVYYSGCSNIPFQSAASGLTAAGQSFRSSSAGAESWVDISANGQNACVKLIADELSLPRPGAISLSPPRDIQVIRVGETVNWSYDLTVAGGPASGADTSVVWASGDTSVARVDAAGNVTGVGGGSCVISVMTRSGRREDSREVYVPPVAVTALKLNRSEIKVKTNQTAQLTAAVTPSNATDKTLEWSSSDESVATVTSLGQVTGVGPGSAVITAASVSDPYIYASCDVEVSKDYVSSITLSRRTLATAVGSITPIGIKTGPATAYDTALEWELVSGNPDVVEIDHEKGTVTGRMPGKAEFRISPADINPDAKKTPSATLTVTVSPLADSYVNVGKTITLTSALTGVKADDIEWEITGGDDTDLTPNKNKAKLYGRRSGEFRVTSYDKNDPDNKHVVSVFVKTPAKKVAVRMESDESNKPARRKELTLDQDGSNPSSVSLAYTIGPDDASYKDVTWVSSKPHVATVDENGVVTAVGPGTAVITCKAIADTAKATFGVTVKYNPTAIELNRTETQRIAVGKKFSLRAAVERTRNVSRTVTWSSSDESVAKVSRTGQVTVVGAGAATITAAAAGGVSASVAVEGMVPVKRVVTGASTVTLKPGETYILGAYAMPADASYKELTYASSKSGVVTVDENGVVTAVGKGSSTVTIKAAVGSAKKSVTFRVKA